MANEYDEVLGSISRGLEEIAELRKKELVTQTEFDELRAPLVNALKSCFTSLRQRSADGSIAKESLLVVPYGTLHARIVGEIARNRTDATIADKNTILTAIAKMAEQHALYEGDVETITALVEVLFEPEKWKVSSDRSQEELLLQTLSALITASTKVSERTGASPAAIAIAETMQQSGARAVAEITDASKPPPPNTPIQSRWRKLVLNDVDGAFQGGAAAVSIAPAFGALPFAIPIAAAFGVVVGAGIRSGLAYGDLPK